MLMICWLELRHITLLISGAKKAHLNLFIYTKRTITTKGKKQHISYFKFKVVFVESQEFSKTLVGCQVGQRGLQGGPQGACLLLDSYLTIFKMLKHQPCKQ